MKKISKKFMGLLFCLLFFVVGCSDFQIHFQLSDDGSSGGYAGQVVETSWVLEQKNDWSDWGGDENFYDPDAIRVGLYTNPGPSGSFELQNIDFRLVVQLSDGGPGGGEIGLEKATPWASQGGGWSGWATDENGYDFDTMRMKIETRQRTGFIVKDFRIGIQLADNGGGGEFGVARYTPYASTGGGWTQWAGDSNYYDPDAVRIKLEITTGLKDLSDFNQPPSN